jgi:hypothetical protein
MVTGDEIEESKVKMNATGSGVTSGPSWWKNI